MYVNSRRPLRLQLALDSVSAHWAADDTLGLQHGGRGGKREAKQRRNT